MAEALMSMTQIGVLAYMMWKTKDVATEGWPHVGSCMHGETHQGKSNATEVIECCLRD